MLALHGERLAHSVVHIVVLLPRPMILQAGIKQNLLFLALVVAKMSLSFFSLLEYRFWRNNITKVKLNFVKITNSNIDSNSSKTAFLRRKEVIIAIATILSTLLFTAAIADLEITQYAMQAIALKLV